MPTNDLIPLFFSDHTEQAEQLGIGKAWDKAAISSRILKTSILVVTASAIVFAVLLVGDPLALFANAAASLVGPSAPQGGTAQSMPIIQLTADAQALPPTARETPTGGETAAAIKIAYQSQTEIRQPPAEALALFKEFQAWAAEEDARAQVRPLQPVHDARAQVVQITRAQAPPAQKHRNVRPLHNARADVRPVQKHREVRSVQNARADVRPVHNARQVRPEQDARVQDRSVQNAQTQWPETRWPETQWPERKFGWLY
jgi:hypothetical protein